MNDNRESSIHFLRRVLGDDMRPVSEQLRAPSKRRHLKIVRERPVCHGKDARCLAGKGGRCCACADDD